MYTIAFGALRGLGIVVLCVIVSAPFLERRFHFRSMSMGVPFSMALAEMREKHEPYAVEGPTQEGSRCARPLVYLAGGLHSGWQDRVMVQARECQYLDPREHGVKDPKGYTHWDLQAVRACDIVFAFLEATNPGGYALALEIGYAAALGKTIILVDEKSAADPAVARYLEMVREAATYKSSSLHDGIEHLRKWLMLVRR